MWEFPLPCNWEIIVRETGVDAFLCISENHLHVMNKKKKSEAVPDGLLGLSPALKTGAVSVWETALPPCPQTWPLAVLAGSNSSRRLVSFMPPRSSTWREERLRVSEVTVF